MKRVATRHDARYRISAAPRSGLHPLQLGLDPLQLGLHPLQLLQLGLRPLQLGLDHSRHNANDRLAC